MHAYDMNFDERELIKKSAIRKVISFSVISTNKKQIEKIIDDKYPEKRDKLPYR